MNHEKIVKFVGYSATDERKMILMEFMERGTLFDVLHKDLQNFTWPQKLYFIKQVTFGMKYLHSQNTAHCDLSSKNLLMGKKNEIKISDFGYCERLDQLPSKIEDEKVAKARGTLRWMSKEMLQKDIQYLDKSDVWSFGVIMFEIGAQTIPYWNLTDTDVRSEIKKGSWPVAKDFQIWMNEKISNKWKLLMDLCFQNPNLRPSFEILDLDIALLIKSYSDNRQSPTNSKYELRKKNVNS